MFSPLEGLWRRDFVVFVHWESTLVGTSLCFVHWNGTLDGNLLCFFHWNGTLKDILLFSPIGGHPRLHFPGIQKGTFAVFFLFFF